MNYFSSLKEVFSRTIYWAILMVAFLLLAIILSITSGFFLPAFMEFNQTAQPLNIAIVIAIAFLLSLNLTIFIRNYEAKNQDSTKTNPHKPHRLAHWAGCHEHACECPGKSCFIRLLIFCFVVSYKYSKVQSQQKCNCNNYCNIKGLGCLVEFHECGKEETRGY